jgi:Spy/CpxP family protein refolding chaperone
MVIFGTGVITGGLLVKNTTGPVKDGRPKKVVIAPGTNQPPVNVTPPQMLRMEFLLRANKDLNLTPEQHERIEKIIREGQEKSRKLWDSVAPEMRKELQIVHEKIRNELTPEQRKRFEQLLKNAPRPGRIEEGQPPQLRDRNRSQNNVTPPFNPDGSPRPPRRENLPPPNNPPPQENPQPAPAEPR